MIQLTSDGWLSIREASQVLGVHIGTVREWADAGRLASYRTPGGHRRFKQADLQRFLTQRRQPGNSTPDARALDRVRESLHAASRSGPPWVSGSTDHSDQTRETGRQLLACVMRFAQDPPARESLLVEGRQIAGAYGQALCDGGLSAGNAARATLRVRRLVLQAVLAETLGARTGDEEDAQFFQRISDFLDEILLTVLNVYP